MALLILNVSFKNFFCSVFRFFSTEFNMLRLFVSWTVFLYPSLMDSSFASYVSLSWSSWFFLFLWFGMYCFSLWSLKVSVEESVVFLMDFPLNETFSLQFSILFLLLFPHILNVLTVICCGEFLFLPWIPGTCVLLCLYGYVFS